MKLKYYMRGLGIGIVLTTLILTISNPKEKLSDEEIIKRAEELGMKTEEVDKFDEVLASSSPSMTPASDPSLAPSGEPTITPSASVTPEPSPTPQPTKKPTIMPKPTATIAPTVTMAPTSEELPDQQTPSQDITFSVKRGMSSGQVAILLLEKGLIDNAEDFNNYIVKVGKSDIIRVGTYTLPKGSTYEEIVDKLTSK